MLERLQRAINRWLETPLDRENRLKDLKKAEERADKLIAATKAKLAAAENLRTTPPKLEVAPPGFPSPSPISIGTHSQFRRAGPEL